MCEVWASIPRATSVVRVLSALPSTNSANLAFVKIIPPYFCFGSFFLEFRQLFQKNIEIITK